MENPYEILELKKGATKDEVRRAYKKLASIEKAPFLISFSLSFYSPYDY